MATTLVVRSPYRSVITWSLIRTIPDGEYEYLLMWLYI